MLLRKILLALMVAIGCLYSPAAQAQTVRPLTIQLDSVTFNVCDGAKTFIIPVSIGDIQVADSLAAVQIYLAWDKVNLDIEDQVIASSETIGVQFSEKSAIRNRDEGSMVIALGNTDINRVVAGVGKPLFFLKGRVIAPDVVGANNGWILVLSMTTESVTRFEPIDKSRPGLIHVIRDTSAAYTGKLSAGSVSFDTARVDTVTLTVGNLRNRRVNEINFSVGADSRHFTFVDTIQAGTIAGTVAWTTKEVQITPDSISGTLVAQSDLTVDGAMLKLVLRRTTDSDFTSQLDVRRFDVNNRSCLGKVLVENGSVSGKAIKVSSAVTGEERTRKGGEVLGIRLDASEGSLRIRCRGEWRQAMLFDVNGRLVEMSEVEYLDAETLRVRLTTVPPSGIYFVGLRGRNEIVYKQFSIEK